MQWKVDLGNKGLELGGHYWIGFDRLKEVESEEAHDSWFVHLAKKNWVEMDELFDAFVAAYDAAGLDFSENFFKNYMKGLSERVSSDFYYKVHGVWSDKFRPDGYFFGLTEAKFSGEMVNDIVSGVESYDA